MIERKPQVALLAGVGRHGFLQSGIATDRRIQADVVLERGEVQQDAVLAERGHLVADRLFRVGRSLVEKLAYTAIGTGIGMLVDTYVLGNEE